jgi:hypothetical protein
MRRITCEFIAVMAVFTISTRRPAVYSRRSTSSARAKPNCGSGSPAAADSPSTNTRSAWSVGWSANDWTPRDSERGTNCSAKSWFGMRTAE